MNCLVAGLTYESAVAQRLAGLKNVVVTGETAGASRGQDITATITIGVIAHTVNIEAKDSGAFEGGQLSLPVRDGAYVYPNDAKGRMFRSLASSVMPPDGFPWNGAIPSFKRGNKTLATWESEKYLFPDTRYVVRDSIVTEYYRAKGTHYIQVEGKGLYHTGDDVCGFGVPLFRAETTLRVRCKQHGSTPMPGSVMLSLNYKKSSIPNTPVCIMTNPPASIS
jgi:hypothetical protein